MPLVDLVPSTVGSAQRTVRPGGAQGPAPLVLKGVEDQAEHDSVQPHAGVLDDAIRAHVLQDEAPAAAKVAGFWLRQQQLVSRRADPRV